MAYILNLCMYDMSMSLEFEVELEAVTNFKRGLEISFVTPLLTKSYFLSVHHKY